MVENYGAVYCTEAGVAKFDRSLIFSRTIHGPEASKRVQRLSNSAAIATGRILVDARDRVVVFTEAGASGLWQMRRNARGGAMTIR